MIKQIPWFERKFTLDYPTGIYPCLLERFRGTPARIEEMVRDISPVILTAKPGGKWSMQEHVGHLYDLEELGEMRAKDYQQSLPTLSVADLRNRKTEEAHHNSRAIRELLVDFRAARIHLAGVLEHFSEDEITRRAVHPRLNQSMRAID
ncbi:MAG TPA: DinB family protein [Bacteroidota bacterium]|nr:DinB family protein [Bacteroidota bacterium]